MGFRIEPVVVQQIPPNCILGLSEPYWSDWFPNPVDSSAGRDGGTEADARIATAGGDDKGLKPVKDSMSDIKADDDVSKDTELIQIEVNDMPSAEQEEEVVKKKYGGMLPKKPPLISKDHERAYFDSADWALGKQEGHAQKPKGPLEALRPKLQPTQQQVRSRRSAYASAESEDGGNGASEGVSDNNDGPNSREQ